MADEPISLLEVQCKRVNEFCQKVCKIQLDILKDTAFESFSSFLEKSWAGVFEMFESRNDIVPSPVFQVAVYENTLFMQSALVSIQFTDKPMPYTLSNVAIPIKNFLKWELAKGDGTITPKIPNVLLCKNSTDDEVGQMFSDMLNDILPNINGRSCKEYPMHLITLMTQIILYHTANAWEYEGFENTEYVDGIEGPITVVTFSKGLHVSKLYIGEQPALEDWTDLLNRFEETYKEFDEQHQHEGPN